MWDRSWYDDRRPWTTEAQPDTIRAGNADREATAELLRTHHTEGRITDDEFAERLERSMSARTLGDLRALAADLPRPLPPRGRGRGWGRRGPRFFPVLLALTLVWALVGRHAGWHHAYAAAPYAGAPYGGYVGHPFPWPLLIAAAVAGYAFVRRRARRVRWA
ncbi:hypothetical protein tb265_29590 [Gemmatimonadetes bacterium T265]|nr:hypothetical protein tb265_29590 [Gemmatimonadetes bacterium T265]